ncbi:transcription factor HFR1-like [Chenopodium quinoa]|uniref:transcription factor HFR1-like n=1 Tax=Chenopodium quinoa TaxID=63459 RepID=UPI000B7801B9|nr:transcription factor HFR1-like [Chenopodium quinoa]
MRVMQALVPTCDKGDHASILDHTIKYIKSMKLQIDMMSRSFGQSQLQNLYAPQMMMQPTMVPRLRYGTWPSHMSPSGYTYMVTPPCDGGVPIQPVPQVQAQAQTLGTFASILCPLQYLSTTIPTPATPTVMSFVPPLPQLTQSNSSDAASHIQPRNS